MTQYIITDYDGRGMLDNRMAIRFARLEKMFRVTVKVICVDVLMN